MSATTRSIPTLSIVRRPFELTLSEIQRFSDGSQKRFLWALTFHQRLVLMFEWETVWPVEGRFPRTSQRFGIGTV
ncbi:MAG: hypothetical protein RLZZ43_378 [Actinomycetota bacterium]